MGVKNAVNSRLSKTCGFMICQLDTVNVKNCDDPAPQDVKLPSDVIELFLLIEIAKL